MILEHITDIKISFMDFIFANLQDFLNSKKVNPIQ